MSKNNINLKPLVVHDNKFNLPKIDNQISILTCFNQGLINEKFKLISSRNDTKSLFTSKKKYDSSISSSLSSTRKNIFSSLHPQPKVKPIIKSNGINILYKSPETFIKYKDIYNIDLSELDDPINISFFSLLPNLMSLSIRQSKISLMGEIEFLSVERYPSLIDLNLSCNNLDNKCLEVIRHIHKLKRLVLMGNCIDEKICDISSLVYLEELDLSFNCIESHFINLNSIKDQIFNEGNNNMIDLEGVEEEEKNKLNNGKISEFSVHRSINSKHFEEIKSSFEKYKSLLKTNIQDFFHILSSLKSLKSLNLSNNKINFFDIDPYHISETHGFSKLASLDLSNNIIDDELGILLVINIPLIESIKINGNPITKNNLAFENVKFEVFKAKNILIYGGEIKYKKQKIKIKKCKDVDNYPPFKYKVNNYKVIKKSKKDLVLPIQVVNGFFENKITNENSNKISDLFDEQRDNKNNFTCYNSMTERNNSNFMVNGSGKLCDYPLLMTKINFAGKTKHSVKKKY